MRKRKKKERWTIRKKKRMRRKKKTRGRCPEPQSSKRRRLGKHAPYGESSSPLRGSMKCGKRKLGT